MIYSLNGKLILKEANLAVVECGGVGYACRTTYNTVSGLSTIGETVRLFTYMHISQDNIDLFGFKDLQELNCFKMLLTVSGVGPKAALQILSDFTPEDFAVLVVSGDSKMLTQAKGIGKKTAERIVLELKDKISKETGMAVNSEQLTVNGGGQTALAESLEALLVLGYSQGEVMPILSRLSATAALSTQDLIKDVLKQLSSK